MKRPDELDVWVLAGQSNMQGCGWLARCLPPDESVWSFTSASAWVDRADPEHSVILLEGKTTRCLVKQICGPICRRVVYWLEAGQDVPRGFPIGMMKFGSRLDMYFPKEDIEVVATEGIPVRAGETVVARLGGEQ